MRMTKLFGKHEKQRKRHGIKKVAAKEENYDELFIWRMTEKKILDKAKIAVFETSKIKETHIITGFPEI